MKKVLIAAGIILTSGIAALSLNKKTEPKAAQVKITKTTFDSNNTYSNTYKTDLANAD